MEHVTIVKILYRGLHRDDIVCEKKNVKYTFQWLKTSIIVIQKFIIHKITIILI